MCGTTEDWIERGTYLDVGLVGMIKPADVTRFDVDSICKQTDLCASNRSICRWLPAKTYNYLGHGRSSISFLIKLFETTSIVRCSKPSDTAGTCL